MGCWGLSLGVSQTQLLEQYVYWGSQQEITLWKLSLQSLPGTNQDINNWDISCCTWCGRGYWPSEPETESQSFVSSSPKRFASFPELKCFFLSWWELWCSHHACVKGSSEWNARLKYRVSELWVYLCSFPVSLFPTSASILLLPMDGVFLFVVTCLKSSWNEWVLMSSDRWEYRLHIYIYTQPVDREMNHTHCTRWVQCNKRWWNPDL